jgi:hypothetical protein
MQLWQTIERVSMTRLTSALIFRTVGVVAIDSEWDGFVHFKNWKGVAPNAVEQKLPFQGNPPTNVHKDICAADSACKGISQATPDSGACFGAFLDVGGTTNTTYAMYLGIENDQNAAPAAMCIIESGGGSLPNVKWLACDNGFCFAMPVPTSNPTTS